MDPGGTPGAPLFVDLVHFCVFSDPWWLVWLVTSSEWIPWPQMRVVGCQDWRYGPGGTPGAPPNVDFGHFYALSDPWRVITGQKICKSAKNLHLVSPQGCSRGPYRQSWGPTTLICGQGIHLGDVTSQTSHHGSENTQKCTRSTNSGAPGVPPGSIWQILGFWDSQFRSRYPFRWCPKS